MKINLPKLALSFVIVLAMAVAQSCLEKDDVKPTPNHSEASTVPVVEEIKNLGFDAADIQDKGNYYLAEGDIYFAKNKALMRTVPVRGKTKEKIAKGQRPAITVSIDQSVAANSAWKSGIDHAITTWNANTDHHFTFNMVENSDQADIFIQDDKGELAEDVEVASEFAAHGYVGSTIRVNLDYATSNANQVKAKALEGLSHSVGLRHADFIKTNDLFKTKASARTSTDASDYVYLIQGDNLYAVRPAPYDGYLVSTSWAGSTKIASTRSVLYVIQFDVLYAALPDGSWWGLTSGWSGTQALVSVPYDSYSLYAMQDDYLWGISAADGGWWQVIQPGVTSTPWSSTKFMCGTFDDDYFSAHANGLVVLDRSNATGPSTSFVPTDPASPHFGRRLEKNRGSYYKTQQAYAPQFDEYGTIYSDFGGDALMFGINSNPSYGSSFGLSDNGGGPCCSALGNVKSDQVINYSKLQSFHSDWHTFAYLITDGGFYTYTWGDALTTVFPPRYLLPTSIMTPLGRIPRPRLKDPRDFKF